MKKDQKKRMHSCYMENYNIKNYVCVFKNVEQK
jgi:hypothetical protein